MIIQLLNILFCTSATKLYGAAILVLFAFSFAYFSGPVMSLDAVKDMQPERAVLCLWMEDLEQKTGNGKAHAIH